jgi:hypothetical protein
MFWQFPCRTEGAAWELHAPLIEPSFDGDSMHVYLGLPWATWIDRRRADPHQEDVHREIAIQRVRISGFRHALRSFAIALRVHTVCQHIYWRDLLDVWRGLGVTDVWLSHAPEDGAKIESGITIHPWRLFAVNVEDQNRCVGLQPGADPARKPLLASFVGAHADHYLSDVRLRLRSLADKPRFFIQVTRKWHFEDIVYRHQAFHEPLDKTYRIDESVREYNRVLSDSVFSLCPTGAGPNTLRLWESLAAGSVPVLLGPAPKLPAGGTLPRIDWDEIVLRVREDQIGNLPVILRRIPLEEVRKRQRLGMNAFSLVQTQRCF